ncbi:MAG TPA: molybdopterin-dependent oxidoreductase [Candidatus Bathyarchaeia archaeon]|nr:molybdopterin-dependent oxidoreductase [Candidatus Bathyarchaeia archaeon]
MTVSLTINGLTVNTERGTTILEAAKLHGIYIPTLCHHPKLTPVGACRLCVVEIEKMRGLHTACTVPVSEGMVVRTETELLRELRRTTLSFILSEHPYTCLVCTGRPECDDFQGTIRKAAVTTGCQYCPQNGRCELQKLTDYLELKEIPYPISYRGLPLEQDDPFFDRDYNLCVLCGRCVRVCQDVRHAGVLTFAYRGIQTIVCTAFGRSHLEADCQFCGACVDICPTGALADKRGKWEGIPTALTQSVCPYCAVGCAVNLEVKNDHIIRPVGHDGPTNHGQLCVRGRFGVVEVVHSHARLKSPLVRRNGKLVEASWDEALETAAQGLSKYQGDQFSAVSSASATNEESYVLQKFARAVMHSNNVTIAGALPEREDQDEQLDNLRTINNPTIGELRDAAIILVIGANVYESHPIVGLEILHALDSGASLITIDVRQIKMAKRSSLWLQPKIGTDHVLLAAIIKTLSETESIECPNELADLDLATVTSVTGVSKESIVDTARRLMERRPIVIIYGSGVTDYSTGPEVIKAIQNLAFTLGNTRIMLIPGEGNFVGAHDMGVHPAMLPGYCQVSDSEARAFYEAKWKTTLSPKPGLNYEETLTGIREGLIKAVYLDGNVPQFPELANLSFLVLQGIVSTENMRYAHVVFPSTTFVEMDGTLTNLEGRVQRLHQAIPPVEQSRPGWKIINDLAERIAHVPWNYHSAAEVMMEIASVVPAYAKVDYETLSVEGLLRRFQPTAKMQFIRFNLNKISQLSSDEFPLILITERNLFHYHAADLTKHVTGMNLIKESGILQLNPSDAAKLGIVDGDSVKVESRYGSTEFTVRISDLPGGTAFTSINPTVGSPLFLTGMLGSKACAIRVSQSMQPSGIRGGG